MFADDWDDPGENDDHLPISERGWYRRLIERAEAAERFDRKYPDFFARMGAAAAAAMLEGVLISLRGEKID